MKTGATLSDIALAARRTKGTRSVYSELAKRDIAVAGPTTPALEQLLVIERTLGDFRAAENAALARQAEEANARAEAADQACRDACARCDQGQMQMAQMHADHANAMQAAQVKIAELQARLDATLEELARAQAEEEDEDATNAQLLAAIQEMRTTPAPAPIAKSGAYNVVVTDRDQNGFGRAFRITT